MGIGQWHCVRFCPTNEVRSTSANGAVGLEASIRFKHEDHVAGTNFN